MIISLMFGAYIFCILIHFVLDYFGYKELDIDVYDRWVELNLHRQYKMYERKI
jgi:hypothetical protein